MEDDHGVLVQASAVQMTHYLNNIMCKVSEHFTSLEGLKVCTGF
jgi:hypothetical protein